MTKCKCGSYAINKHRQHFTSSLTSCDPCHWRDRAEYLELQLVEILQYISSIEDMGSLEFKKEVLNRSNLIADRVEKYHMDQQEKQQP